MEKPLGFRSCGVDWAIEWTNEGSFKLDYRGRSFIEEQRIQMNDSLSEASQRKTLLHELIHVGGDTILDNESQLSERQVRALAHGLFDILASNPAVVRYIVGGYS